MAAMKGVVFLHGGRVSPVALGCVVRRGLASWVLTRMGDVPSDQ